MSKTANRTCVTLSAGAWATMSTELEGELEEVVRGTTLAIEAGAKAAILTGTRTGRSYPRGGRVHIASAPGEAPANDYGNLVGGISTDVRGLTGTVNVASGYGPVLEFGGARMEARPFLTPAVEAERDGFEQAVAAAFQRAVGKT